MLISNTLVNTLKPLFSIELLLYENNNLYNKLVVKKTIPTARKHSKRKILLLLLFLLFIGIRLFHLSERVDFGPDQGRDFLVTYQIYLDKQIKLIGPPSEYTLYGRQFFFGPAPYYFILPALLMGQWNPLSVSYFIIFLNFAVLIIAVILLNKYLKEKLIVYAFTFLCCVTPLFVEYSQSYWNPYFMLPISLLLVPLLTMSKYKPSNSLIFFIIIGFIFGLGMQFHYSFIFAVILGVIWLMVNKKITIKSSLSLSVGFVLGFLPLIIFELRNNFYNTNTFLLLLQSSTHVHTDFSLHAFYFISVLPFFFFILSWVVVERFRVDHNLLYAGLIVYALISILIISFQHTPSLSYSTLKQISQVIHQDHLTEFNIVDQLTGDNRAMALRYLLTVDNSEPLSVTEYPKVKLLYVYSREPIALLLKNPVWEISSAKIKTVTQIWRINKDIYLYKLTK